MGARPQRLTVTAHSPIKCAGYLRGLPGRPTHHHDASARARAHAHARSAPKVLEPQSTMICSPTATAEHSVYFSMPRATDLRSYSERRARLAEPEPGGSQAERASPTLRAPSFTSLELPASQSSVMLKDLPSQ